MTGGRQQPIQADTLCRYGAPFWHHSECSYFYVGRGGQCCSGKFHKKNHGTGVIIFLKGMELSLKIEALILGGGRICFVGPKQLVQSVGGGASGGNRGTSTMVQTPHSRHAHGAGAWGDGPPARAKVEKSNEPVGQKTTFGTGI